MCDVHEDSRLLDRNCSTPVLLPALLLSVAVHAAAGGLLFHGWQRMPVETPQSLTVILEVAAPSAPQTAPPRVERHHAERAANRRAAQPLSMHHSPERLPVADERVDAPPPAVTSAPEAASAPALIDMAPPTVNATGRAEALELPHINVAYLSNPRPAYPPIARKLGLEGLVVLHVQVSAEGMPEKVAVAQTSGAPVLDEAALKAVHGWKFMPARRGDIPIAHVVNVPIRFQLKN